MWFQQVTHQEATWSFRRALQLVLPQLRLHWHFLKRWTDADWPQVSAEVFWASLELAQVVVEGLDVGEDTHGVWFATHDHHVVNFNEPVAARLLSATGVTTNQGYKQKIRVRSLSWTVFISLLSAGEWALTHKTSVPVYEYLISSLKCSSSWRFFLFSLLWRKLEP